VWGGKKKIVKKENTISPTTIIKKPNL